jgi:hypothetical protein
LISTLLTPNSLTFAHPHPITITTSAILDTKPGEAEVYFSSTLAKQNLSSFVITAKPKSGSGLIFSKKYTKKVSGYLSQKISPLTPGTEYIFSITATATNKKIYKAKNLDYQINSTLPDAPTITKVTASDADAAIIEFDQPKSNGGTPVLYYTANSNTGVGVGSALHQGSGSITITGLTKLTTYTFTVVAHNLNGPSIASKISLPVTTLAEKIIVVRAPSTPALAAPAFTLSSPAETRTAGVALTGYSISSTGGTIASYSISATPAGLTFNTSTGLLSGSPSSVAAATAYTITAINAAGSATRTFTLRVLAIVYSIGQTGPGGGRIFYADYVTGFTCFWDLSRTCNYLESAPTAGASAWVDATYLWSGNTVNAVAGATNDGIGYGFKNTVAIVDQAGGGSDAGKAGTVSRAYRGPNNLNDWFLPSKDELNQLYLQRASEVFDLSNYYWSSSQDAGEAAKAWGQLWGIAPGTQGTITKAAPARFVRPIRAG